MVAFSRWEKSPEITLRRKLRIRYWGIPVGRGRGLPASTLAWIIHEQTLILKKAAKLGALARGVFEAFDTLSFLIEAQNMVQVPVLTGFYAF